MPKITENQITEIQELLVCLKRCRKLTSKLRRNKKDLSKALLDKIEKEFLELRVKFAENELISLKKKTPPDENAVSEKEKELIKLKDEVFLKECDKMGWEIL